MQIQNLPEGTPTISDLVLFQSVVDGSYRKSLIAGLPGSVNNWQIVSTDFTTEVNKKVLNTATTNTTLTLPTVSSGEVEIFNLSASNKIFINLQGRKYRGANYNTANLVCRGADTYVRLVYVNDSIGWHPIAGQLQSSGVYPTGMAFWLENGELTDKSGNGRNATPVGVNRPVVAVGIDGKNVLRWGGTSNQELQVSPFLAGTTGATLYCVFSVSANTNYNLVKTANLDDYWRLSSNSAGYIGTFRNARIEQYPAGMPQSGHHLVTVHANASGYEVTLDNSSKGLRAETYFAGDRFRIGTNDKAFNGDIALILCYPYWIGRSSIEHISCVEAIKQFYPSLPFTL